MTGPISGSSSRPSPTRLTSPLSDLSDAEASTEVAVTAEKAKEKKSRTKKVKQAIEPSPSDYPTRVDTPWKIGAHVSAAGGVENAILNAAAIGYEIQS